MSKFLAQRNNNTNLYSWASNLEPQLDTLATLLYCLTHNTTHTQHYPHTHHIQGQVIDTTHTENTSKCDEYYYSDLTYHHISSEKNGGG